MEEQGGETRTSTFHVRMERCPHTLCRITGLFAQRDQAISRLTLTETAHGHHLVLVATAMSRRRAEVIAEKIANIVTVESVELSFG